MSEQLGLLIGVVVTLAVCAVVAGLFLRRRYQRLLGLTTTADSVSFAPTKDGHAVALYRYRPAQMRQGELPIVLCHGLGANRFNLDFDDKYSFARYLKGRGYDVFVVELRGADRGAPAAKYSFDDLVEQDVPAILDEVQTLTGAAKVNWVGHSLGGMLAYAALGGASNSRIHALATLGTPATFAYNKWLRRLASAYFLVRSTPQSWGPWLARLYAPWAFVPLPFTAFFANRKNFEPRVWQQVLWNVVSPSSSGVLDQLVTAVKRGSPAAVSSQTDPEAHFRTINHPILMIAGQADILLAPPSAVRHAFYAVASEQKELVVLSKKNGFSADYGHGDLILGKNAPTEVFPLVERFLWKHRRADVESARRSA